GPKTPPTDPPGGSCAPCAPARGQLRRWLAADADDPCPGGSQPHDPGHPGDRAGPGSGLRDHLGVWPTSRHDPGPGGRLPQRRRGACRRVAPSLRERTGHGRAISADGGRACPVASALTIPDEGEQTMPSYVYVAAQDDNHIAVFTINDETGGLTPQAETPMPGGPSLLAISPNRHCLYVGHRTVPQSSSHRID